MSEVTLKIFMSLNELLKSGRQQTFDIDLKGGDQIEEMGVFAG
jgi:hypothetical protein